MSIVDPTAATECDCIACTNPSIDKYCSTCKRAGCDESLNPNCTPDEPTL